ncbi:protease SohB [Thiotrichales bacterium 19S11-10]|nr:protease SohB [Thiotrichales bacterium 19S11-10]MCF6807353.1 protease SohB [Thiotrichales bacterium 19S9-11]MCF6811322.1 protease SohB [Thiotrichales bacterium 19S9-12]
MWLENVSNYVFFLAEVITIVVAILLVLIGTVAILAKGKVQKKGQLTIQPMDKEYKIFKNKMAEEVLPKDKLKILHKEEKKALKKVDKEKEQPRVYVVSFDGDIHASQAEQLAKEVTAILTIATKEDEVVVKLTSGGGTVHGYGLASSQLERIRKANIPLTIVIDKVAASGGYMMASLGDKLIAAPFAIIGSIGVISQLPNFNRWLESHGIDFEQHTAGQFKRTLTMFGKNTDEGREKFKAELEEIHRLFKQHIQKFRPMLNIEKVATGEFWLGEDACQLGLVDEVSTSDDYLFDLYNKQKKLYQVQFNVKRSPMKKLTSKAQSWLLKQPEL